MRYGDGYIKFLLLMLSSGVMLGCSVKPADTFTLRTDMPANFRLNALASFVPATGETCTIKRRTPTQSSFKSELQESAHTVEFDIPLAKIADSCPLVLKSIKLDLRGQYGETWEHGDSDFAWISLRDSGTVVGSNNTSNQVFNGQCQWLFRTMGSGRHIFKILKCRAEDESNQVLPRLAGGILMRDQLAGKTVNLTFTVADEEVPAVGDNWVRFKSGWKRCMGKNLNDPYAFCDGNVTDFKSFKMPDGRECASYPNCID